MQAKAAPAQNQCEVQNQQDGSLLRSKLNDRRMQNDEILT